jgi:preprotein translocase SecE subunit
VARNRQRNRSGRPDQRPARPYRSGDGGRPPIEDDPAVAFADGDDDEGLEVTQASAAFGPAEHHDHPRGTHPRGLAGRLRGAWDWLKSSWAELQRVQWPDRQQVAQATGVVLGFVVLTGVFLGVADYVAGKLINWIV